MKIFPDEYLPEDYEGPSAGSTASVIGKRYFIYASQLVKKIEVQVLRNGNYAMICLSGKLFISLP